MKEVNIDYMNKEEVALLLETVLALLETGNEGKAVELIKRRLDYINSTYKNHEVNK